MFIKKRKLFIPISFCAALLLLTSYTPEENRLWPLRVLTQATHSVQSLLTSITDNINQVFTHYIFLINVAKKNSLLEKENILLTSKAIQLKALQEQYEELQFLLNIKSQTPKSIETVAARVISYNTNPESATLTINKGSNDNIQKFDGVMTHSGFVGYVIEVFPNSALILFITNRYAIIETECTNLRVLTQGYEQGIYAPHVNYQPNNKKEPFRKGDYCKTSPMSKIRIPAGIPIGQISRIEKNPLESNQQIFITPSIRLDTIKYVLVTIEKQ